tara:strand:- start:3884 stop:4321 length:438 start_codon:yes stop_codon:yes gene_type:complete
VELLILVKSPSEDIFRKRPILGHRVLTPVRDNKEKDPKFRPRPILESFSQRTTGNDNTQISAGGNVRTNLPQEPTAMDLAMEEIRAAQKQREEQARKFEEMMSGSFAAAFPQNISQEMADAIAAFKLQGMSDEQATDSAKQYLGQ